MKIPKFRYLPLAKASLAQGAVVVIDVLRAFTTAAYAFVSGALEIHPVGSVDEALQLRDRMPDAAIMGEVDGIKPYSFDFSNSPAEILQLDLSGKRLIQSTSAGTRGIVSVRNAQTMLASSFVVSKATAKYLVQTTADLISFVITGQSLGRDGDEDRACAEYIEALVLGEDPDPSQFTSRVLTSSVGKSFNSGELGYLVQQDIALSLKINRFDFYLEIQNVNGLLVMVPHRLA